MDKIPTAEEWLTSQVIHPSQVPVIKDIMLKFAKLHVEAFRSELIDEPTYYLEGDEGSERLDIEKIRKELYPLTNIK